MPIPPSWHPPSILLFALGLVALSAYWLVQRWRLR
jgi:hypothetical protein